VRKETKQAWQYYAKCYRQHYRALGLVVVVAFAQFFLVLPFVYLISYVFDHIIPLGQFRLLLLVGFCLFALNAASSGVTLWIRHLTLRITKFVVKDIRYDLLRKVYALPRAFYDKAETGRLHSRIAHDTEHVDLMGSALVAQLIPNTLICTALNVVLLSLNWKLFLVLTTIGPLCLIAHQALKKMVQERARIFRQAYETFSKGIYTVLEMIDLTRLQAAEDFEMARQQEHVQNVRRTSSALVWLETAYGLSQHFLSTLASIVILVFGAACVISRSMSMGHLVAFYVAVGLLAANFAKVLQTVPLLITGNESLLSLCALLQTTEHLPYSGIKKIPFQGRLELDSVHFQYTEQELLTAASLTVEARSVVAIVGANGSGKTTIIYLLTGLYKPNRGGLLADGYSYDELDMVELRRSIGVVPQDPVLFSGTVRENITYGFAEATAADVVQAAKWATADEFIRELPLGYDTQIGEGGGLLSGGQRQRVAIARALLRCPKLLILDEPSNHLDDRAVRRLMHNLRSLPAHPTVILVSHDLRVIRGAACIYSLRNGKLVEVGAKALSIPSFQHNPAPPRVRQIG
jgi:ABC-type bacteriocin/lantibiotic exporter with double-glycine peptidase domain